MTGDAAFDEAVVRLRRVLVERSGFAADLLTTPRLVAEIESSMGRHGGGPAETADRLLGDQRAYAALEASFAPPETWLFRYPESFELVRRRAREWRGRPLRAVVAGAGGWAEPCALAAALLDGAGASADIRVVAVDRNPRVLEAEPTFAGLALRGGLPDWAERWFPFLDGARTPTAAIRSSIETWSGDIRSFLRTADRRWRGSEIVACRNVAIYLDGNSRREILGGLAELVADEGLLLVGHSEAHAARQATGFADDPAPSAFALRRGGGARSAPDRTAAVAPPPAARLASSARPAPTPTPTPTAPSSSSATPVSAPAQHQPPPPLPTAALFVAEARAFEAAGEYDRAEHAVGRALYLDQRHEEALLLAARLAEARGASAEADRLRARALRSHLDRGSDDRAV